MKFNFLNKTQTTSTQTTTSSPSKLSIEELSAIAAATGGEDGDRGDLYATSVTTRASDFNLGIGGEGVNVGVGVADDGSTNFGVGVDG